MGICHHVDWDNLQILVDGRKQPPTYKCILCDKEFDEKEYKELIQELRGKAKKHEFDKWRTPNGELQKVEEE